MAPGDPRPPLELDALAALAREIEGRFAALQLPCDHPRLGPRTMTVRAAVYPKPTVGAEAKDFWADGSG